jgi:tellurite resistance protein
MSSRARAYRVTPNVFGIPFGLCGLAQCWATAHTVAGTPRWPADTLWIITAAVWVATLIWYGHDVVRGGRLRTELTDPVFAPFTALIVIVPMFLGIALAGHARPAGQLVFGTALALTVAIGGWLSGAWIVADLQLTQWHPGYFLPTVGGGLIGAGGSAALGHRTLAMAMFGYGTICWLILGTIILLRLFTSPALPPPLRPTIAIEVAPPVVAGNAWFLLNGGRVDAIAAGLAGYAVLMVLVQLRLIPVFRRVPFGPGWWAFSFSYAAAFTVAVNWLAAARVPGHSVWTAALLAVLTLGIVALAVPTVGRLVKGTYLPAAARPTAAVPPSVLVGGSTGRR